MAHRSAYYSSKTEVIFDHPVIEEERRGGEEQRELESEEWKDLGRGDQTGGSIVSFSFDRAVA